MQHSGAHPQECHRETHRRDSATICPSPTMIIFWGLPHAYPIHIPADQEVKGQSSQGHSDQAAVTRTMRGPRPWRGLADCFHAAWCCCATFPHLRVQRGTVSISRSHSSSVKGRALAPGQDQQGSVLSLRSPPLRQKMKLGAVS